MPTTKHGYPRHLILKDGSEVDLRPLDPAIDEGQLLSFFDRIPSEERWYLADDVSDDDLIRQWARRVDPKRVLPILAVRDDGTVAATATLHRFSHGARGHIGRIRLVVDAEARNQRLGTYLLLDLIQLAVDIGLRLLVLEFIRGVEDKAIRAARRLDFFEQAVLPDYARDQRGNRYDLVIMVKRIHRGYDDF